MAKLPKELRITISRRLSEEWDLKSLLKYFREELQLQEKCYLSAMTAKEKKPEHVNQGPQPPTTGAFHTNYENFSRENSKLDFWCTFCKGNHKSVGCGLVTEPEARRSILRRKGKCFNCLQSGHISPNCQSDRKCYRCGSKHHISICTDQIQKQRPPAFPKQEKTPKGNRTVSTNFYFTRNMSINEHILLETERAKVNSPRSDTVAPHSK
jgi:hypothetical protein